MSEKEKSKLKQFQVSKFQKIYSFFKLHIEKKYIYSAEIVTVIRMVLVPVICTWSGWLLRTGHNSFKKYNYGNGFGNKNLKCHSKYTETVQIN